MSFLPRARSAMNRKIRYGLGCGGYNPKAAHPGAWSIRKFRPAWYCDCSGFIAWVVGRSRKPGSDWKWWFSTDSVYADAMGPQVLFVRIPAGLEQPGDLVVYPDSHTRGPDGKLVTHQGHIALVSDPARHMVIDCGSTSNGITERRLSIMWNKPKAIFCKLREAA
jgi:hypothetical protein